MATTLYRPNQLQGIARAASELILAAANEDEFVHVRELQDGSDVITVELTESTHALYVNRNGKVFRTRPTEDQENA